MLNVIIYMIATMVSIVMAYFVICKICMSKWFINRMSDRIGVMYEAIFDALNETLTTKEEDGKYPWGTEA